MNKRVMALGAAVAIIGSGLFVNAVVAQDEEGLPHPAHIHSGACPAPGDVVAGLGDVSDQFLVEGVATVMPAMGATTAIPVEASVTTVEMAYADIFAAPHAIVVHKSNPEVAVYILCGDIGGPEMGATAIAIGLGPLNESGYNGIATLHDNGDGTTTVSVYVTEEYHAMAPTESTAP